MSGAGYVLDACVPGAADLAGGGDVGQGVAVDQEEVGAETGMYGASVGEVEVCCGQRGGGSQRLGLVEMP